MKSKELYDVQRLLYLWLSKFDRKSLTQIKSNCDYLNEQYNLQLSNPTWEIFWPLVYNGQVDHVGNGYYALTESLIIDYGEYFVHINHTPQKEEPLSKIVGLHITNFRESGHKIKEIKFDGLSVLRALPCISQIVDKFPTTLQDESELKYINYRTRRGIAELEIDGLTRYFSIPEKLYIREIPSRNINPEAYAIAYCYSRVVNNESNGIYIGKEKRLSMPAFAMPFNLYRILLLETLRNKTIPKRIEDRFIFDNISSKIVQELNRILINSIQNE